MSELTLLNQCVFKSNPLNIEHSKTFGMSTAILSSSSPISDDINYNSTDGQNFHQFSNGMAMSSATSSSQDSSPDEDLPKCGKCLMAVPILKVLPCFHSFCIRCLPEMQLIQGVVRCHECQMDICTTPDLPTDFVSANILKQLNGKVEEDTSLSINEMIRSLRCMQCKVGRDSGPVVAHCSTCPAECGFLCKECSSAHKTMVLFRDHQVTPVHDYLATSRPLRCSMHPTETLSYFCHNLGCNSPQCTKCIAEVCLPSRHNYKVLEEEAPQLIQQLERLAELAKNQTMLLRATAENVRQSTESLTRQFDKAVGDINDVFSFYKQQIDDKKNQLLRDLDLAFSDKRIVLSSTASELEAIESGARRAYTYLRRLLATSSRVETLVFKQTLEAKLRPLAEFIPTVNNPSIYTLELAGADKSKIQAAITNTTGHIRQAKNDIRMATGISPQPLQNGNVNCVIEQNSNGNIPNYNMMQAINTQYQNNDSPPPQFGNIVGSWGQTNRPAISTNQEVGDIFSTADMFQVEAVGGSSSNGSSVNGKGRGTPKSTLTRHKMVYCLKFGEFGSSQNQFTEPSGVAANANGDILVADTNNHRVQVFDRDGIFIRQIGENGKNDGQLVYPNRVAVCPKTGNIVITERPPTHQVQIFTNDGRFVRKFGSNVIQHPRGLAVDFEGRIIVVECKVMRVLIYDEYGRLEHKFGCSSHLDFPNGVVVNNQQEIFISDNRSHCVKVFSYAGIYLRQIGGEGLTNYPIGVAISRTGEILIADNHNNFNVTIFNQQGELLTALESRVKHAQCYDVALTYDGAIIVASKDFRVYVYRYHDIINNHSNSTNNCTTNSNQVSPPPGLTHNFNSESSSAIEGALSALAGASVFGNVSSLFTNSTNGNFLNGNNGLNNYNGMTIGMNGSNQLLTNSLYSNSSNLTNALNRGSTSLFDGANGTNLASLFSANNSNFSENLQQAASLLTQNFLGRDSPSINQQLPNNTGGLNSLVSLNGNLGGDLSSLLGELSVTSGTSSVFNNQNLGSIFEGTSGRSSDLQNSQAYNSAFSNNRQAFAPINNSTSFTPIQSSYSGWY